MSGNLEPKWPKILSHSVHEFRTPLGVVDGYLRMILKGMGGGTLTDHQRHVLEEAKRSCARLTALVDEVSELSKLEAGTATFDKRPIDLNAVLRTAVEQLPPLPDREVGIDLQTSEESAPLNGDPGKLAQALGAIIGALRRELVTSDRLLVRSRRAPNGSGGYEILIGDEAAVKTLEAQRAEGDDAPFDQCRGGTGLSLINARRILAAHDASVHGPSAGGKASARILVPTGTSAR